MILPIIIVLENVFLGSSNLLNGTLCLVCGAMLTLFKSLDRAVRVFWLVILLLRLLDTVFLNLQSVIIRLSREVFGNANWVDVVVLAEVEVSGGDLELVASILVCVILLLAPGESALFHARLAEM